jgi:hypothetical protein
MTNKEIYALQIALRTDKVHTATKKEVREEVRKIKGLDHKLDGKLDEYTEDLRRQGVDQVT